MHRTTQQGSVLIVSLVILLVLTLLGINAMGTSSLEEKMAGNNRDHELAFQAAEAALTDAERYIGTLNTTAGFTNAGGLYAIDANPDVNQASTWTAANSLAYPTTLPNIATQPRYIIQLQPEIGDDGVQILSNGAQEKLTIFRITARATGGTDTAVVILQSYFGRYLN
jgi:type IV pilus assembly protein PilX